MPSGWQEVEPKQQKTDFKHFTSFIVANKKKEIIHEKSKIF